MTGVVIIDATVLDTVTGAEYVKTLEENPRLRLVFGIQDPQDRTGAALETSGAVITNTGGLTTQKFWESVFDIVDTAHNTVLAAVPGSRNCWFEELAGFRQVPFVVRLNESSNEMELA